MKAVILAGGRGTRFSPLSQVVPKQYLPLAEKPTFRYLVEEAKASGVEEVVFVNTPGFKEMQDYFSPSDELKEELDKKKDRRNALDLQEQEKEAEEEIKKEEEKWDPPAFLRKDE